MKLFLSKFQNIYIACGKIDMRKQIDGLVHLVKEKFQLDPFSSSVYIFCGGKKDRIKVLLWDGDGFLLLYKRLESGNFKWLKNRDEVEKISIMQLRWLLEGLKIDQKLVQKM